MGIVASAFMLSRRWPWLVLPLLLVIGAARLRFDAEVLNLLPAELPAVRGLALQQRYFAASRELLLTVQSDDVALTERAARRIAERLVAATHLVKSARWQPPWEEQPADLAENLAWQWLQRDPAEFLRLEERLRPAELSSVLGEALQQLASSLDPEELVRTGYDPLGLSRLDGGDRGRWNRDAAQSLFSDSSGTFRVIQVEPATEEGDYRKTARWLADVRATAAGALRELGESEGKGEGAAGRIHLGYTGGPAFRAEISAGMESDLRQSILSTVVLIAGLFWAAHRTWRPLGWLIVALLLTLVLTLGLGGVLFGTLNIISVGFAAVLMGLAVDYGLVSYQEAVANPGCSPREVRHEVRRGIWYSALTTAGTFVLLGWAGLPGLSLLGQMTALGLIVGAVVMQYFYLPKVCPVPPSATAQRAAAVVGAAAEQWRGAGWIPTVGVLLAVVAVLLVRGVPRVTPSEDPLKPRSSQAYTTLDVLRSTLQRGTEPALLVLEGKDAEDVAHRMDATAVAVPSGGTNLGVSDIEMPTTFWPRPEHARQNASVALALAGRQAGIVAAVREAGFSSNATALIERVLGAWPALLANPSPWPTNASAAWLTHQMVARTETGGWLALGRVHPGPGFDPVALTARLPEGVWMSSWDSLGQHLLHHVRGRVVGMTLLIALVLVGCLWTAFRCWTEVGLAAVALGLSFLVLIAVMAVAGWEWNLLSLVALPLILGTSVDSTIHVQLALRRYGGDLAAMWRTTGQALLLCAGANIAGFGSLAWSSNKGLASMDLVCALGVGCVFLVCVGLLPQWWLAARLAPAGGVASPAAPPSPDAGAMATTLVSKTPTRPSTLYQVRLWRAGLAVARRLPARVLVWAALVGIRAYRMGNRERVEIVVRNLEPVLGGDRARAETVAQRLFDEFARKLVELWRQEAGAPALAPVVPGPGWEHFAAARAVGRGILLVTPHLGNWEIGAELLKSQGVALMVLTAPEPSPELTQARLEARRRLGVATVVVGTDPFAFVPVIQHLQAGGAVALLVDRARPEHAVATSFFGHPFRVSPAAAELARASGAAVLPVYLVREGERHRAYALPVVEYDRRELADRAARAEFAGRILRAFEPAIRQFPEQWFHFVPVWEARDADASGTAGTPGPEPTAPS